MTVLDIGEAVTMLWTSNLTLNTGTAVRRHAGRSDLDVHLRRT